MSYLAFYQSYWALEKAYYGQHLQCTLGAVLAEFLLFPYDPRQFIFFIDLFMGVVGRYTGLQLVFLLSSGLITLTERQNS